MNHTRITCKINPIEKVCAWLFVILGAAVIWTIILPYMVSLIAVIYLSDWESAISMMIDMGIPFLLSCLFLAVGISSLKMQKRLKNYMRKIEGVESCELMYLADIADESEEYVIEDLKKMMKKGWIKNAVLDLKSSCIKTQERR